MNTRPGLIAAVVCLALFTAGVLDGKATRAQSVATASNDELLAIKTRFHTTLVKYLEQLSADEKAFNERRIKIAVRVNALREQLIATRTYREGAVADKLLGISANLFIAAIPGNPPVAIKSILDDLAEIAKHAVLGTLEHRQIGAKIDELRTEVTALEAPAKELLGLRIELENTIADAKKIGLIAQGDNGVFTITSPNRSSPSKSSVASTATAHIEPSLVGAWTGQTQEGSWDLRFMTDGRATFTTPPRWPPIIYGQPVPTEMRRVQISGRYEVKNGVLTFTEILKGGRREDTRCALTLKKPVLKFEGCPLEGTFISAAQ